MPAWIILACEVDVVTHEQLTQEVSEWKPPVSAASVQLPPQGFASPGMVHRWVSSELHRGCVVFGLAQRVASLRMYDTFEKKKLVDIGHECYQFGSAGSSQSSIA